VIERFIQKIIIQKKMRDSIRRFTTRTTLTILTILSTIIANAATYYLAPNGSDSGSGSNSSPWFTLNKAWSVAKAGDIIYLKGGTYRYSSTQSLTGKSGASGNPIKIWAVEGETPVITPASDYSGTRGINIDADYLHIKGLEITGYKQRTSSALYYGIVAENSNNITFDQIKVHDNGFGLSIGSDSGDNLVLNSDFYRNADPLSNFGQNVPWGGVMVLPFEAATSRRPTPFVAAVCGTTVMTESTYLKTMVSW
jgi:hypothetical protein